MTMPAETVYLATGRRKTAVARVRLQVGTGQVRINKREAREFFSTEDLQKMIEEPFEAVNSVGQFDLQVEVSGGGIAGQAGAVRLSIARVLEKWNPNFRSLLKRAGLLRRDARVKERKKYGQRGARARFQFSKR